MENWTLDDWLNDLDNCVKRGLYFEISGHSAGLLRDQIKKAADEIERLQLREETLSGIIDGMTARFIEAQGAVEEIERLREDREQLQYALMKVCNSLDDNLPAIITKNIALAALGLPLRGMKEGE